MLRHPWKLSFTEKLTLPLVSTGKRYIMDIGCWDKYIKNCIPLLTPEKHKGQDGRIGIVGGSLEYTGAPYFAGISALKVGADLVHIFCTSSAATVIKSYSPELIVHPLLDHPDGVNEIKPWLNRLHALVIGPGLGRDIRTFQTVSKIITICRDIKMPLIIDADGLYLVTEQLELIKDYPAPGVILTPNKVEFERLYPKIKKTNNECSEDIDFKHLGENVLILKKGNFDEVFSANKNFHWKFNLGGSNRRCGGQGDILSGSLATFFHWTLSNIDKVDIPESQIGSKSLLAASLSSYAAAKLVRLSNEKAFKQKGRSMLATDMIEYLHTSFWDLYEN